MKVLKCEGPRYALVEWTFLSQIPTVWEASDDLAKVFAYVAGMCEGSEGETYSVVEVNQWYCDKHDHSNVFPLSESCTTLATIDVKDTHDGEE